MTLSKCPSLPPAEPDGLLRSSPFKKKISDSIWVFLMMASPFLLNYGAHLPSSAAPFVWNKVQWWFHYTTKWALGDLWIRIWEHTADRAASLNTIPMFYFIYYRTYMRMYIWEFISHLSAQVPKNANNLLKTIHNISTKGMQKFSVLDCFRLQSSTHFSWD